LHWKGGRDWLWKKSGKEKRGKESYTGTQRTRSGFVGKGGVQRKASAP